MWQVLLVAAIAGSTGLIAKHLYAGGKCDRRRQEEERSGSERCEDREEYRSCGVKEEEVFRFSSSGEIGGNGDRLKGGDGGNKLEKRSRVFREGVEQRKSGRRFSVCLRRKINLNLTGKSASCSSKDSSLYGLGLGVVIMYMMSTGKAEISKMSKAMDETAKLVQELRSELYRRKSSRNLSITATEIVTNSKDRDFDDVKGMSPSLNDNGEWPSSVVTEEPENGEEVLEMDQLEAELEAELQKLPWCNTDDDPWHDRNRPNLDEIEVSANKLDDQSPDSYEFHGVLPAELDKKLTHLLIQRQESQIVDLESELCLAQSKLQEKEAELQALKNCVRRLTDFSLSNISDDEYDTNMAQRCTGNWDYNNMIGSESRKSVVGMKRPFGSELDS